MPIRKIYIQQVKSIFQLAANETEGFGTGHLMWFFFQNGRGYKVRQEVPDVEDMTETYIYNNDAKK
jgi:hypothetical protein